MPSNNTSTEHRPIVRVLGSGLIVIFLLVVLELASYITLKFGIIPADATLVYVPPVVDKVVYNDYLDYRHPILGWSTAIKQTRKYSATKESRPNTVFPESRLSCVSIYGDSFTYGSEVTDDETWGNVLSESLDCKVANFGLGGYGMDQAYLRYTLNTLDAAPVNILAVYPYNILRNLNQYRPFLAGPFSSTVALKPRFVIEDEELKLIPPPYFNYNDLVAILDTPQKSFEHETFMPGAQYGPAILKFPYSLVVYKVVTSDAVLNHLFRKPSYTHFFQKNHPSNSMLIARKIAENFARIAKARNHKSLVLIYPTVSSYKRYIRNGEITTQALADVLMSSDINHYDLHSHFKSYLGDRDYCEILTASSSCSGHFNPEGNRVVASAVERLLDNL